MVTDEYGNKLKGFYLVGFFDKGRKAQFSFEPKKPFKTDENGYSSGNCFRGFKRNSFATDWEFIQDRKIKDLNVNNGLRDWCNEIWQRWCSKHKRKYTILFERLNTSNTDKEKEA